MFFVSIYLYQITLPNDSQNQTYITETKLSSFDIQDKDIYKTIKTLDVNKTHGHNEMSIRMLKLCDESIVKPLSIIFKNCIIFKKSKCCSNS